ncbi:hypothetical protein D9619_009479 [Psilocybe cf. subviscida]|uniref:DNA 3'-5' helicase n=1 Tax=Psilocybe cf. subviscida TaxID=2480587 RepID=A0A8H5FA13_9AGAR|nr:hypothetical protein D9619_009479 [Psilocybe cf. subviscida]
MSPEMVLSESFQKLWKDSRFRKRLTAVIIDEAHCIADWGDDDFRPAYRKLDILRNYTGQEIPIVACTATCPTSTFTLVWDTLGYGNRPFWGLDVGVDRPNLLYIARPLENPKQPMLDILNILPTHLNDETLQAAIAKSLLYFDSEAACRTAVQFLRKCLPKHLRDCVQAFSSDLSEEGKAVLWKLFILGVYRILCATDAAGMGCNISNVQHVISFGCPKSLGSLIQRWGRGGRDRATQAVCQLLVPRWAFRPASSLIQQRLAQQTGKSLNETKADTLKRAKLNATVERFINGSALTPSPRKF